jgi:hypothetical protein
MDGPEKEHHQHQQQHDSKDKPPPKEIDNNALAALLRESAKVVERGEFDALLYTALQDFRVYYKVHYPKKKEKPRTRSRSRPRDDEPKPTSNVVSNSAFTSSSKEDGKPMMNGDSVRPWSNISLDGGGASVDGTASAATAAAAADP